MSLRAALDVAVLDDVVEFAFTIVNDGEATEPLRFTSGQAAEFVVNRDGEAVWRWSDGRFFTQALWSETLPPGSSMSFDGTWTDPVPGPYEVVASLEAAGVDLEARAGFEV